MKLLGNPLTCYYFVKNPRASFVRLAVALPLLLSSGWWASLGAESSSRPPASSHLEEANSPAPLQAYRQLQAQLHATELAINQNRQETKAAAAQNVEALSQGLQALQQALPAQRAQDREAMQRSQAPLLMVVGVLAALVFLTLLIMTCFQWRTNKGLAEISAFLSTALELDSDSAAAALDPAEQLNLPLFGATEATEELPPELEPSPWPAFERRAGTSRFTANRLFPARGASLRSRPVRPLKVMGQPHKLLFICGQNRLRSLTAKAMYQDFPGYSVKSAGTEPNARIRVSRRLIRWADVVFVMEKYHELRLRQRFGQDLEGKDVICLNIPDTYRYMEPALVEELKAALNRHVAVPK